MDQRVKKIGEKKKGKENWVLFNFKKWGSNSLIPTTEFDGHNVESTKPLRKRQALPNFIYMRYLGLPNS